MSNTFSPLGAQVFERRDGGSPMYGQQTFLIASSDPTAVYNGDLVQTYTSFTPQSGAVGSFVTQASSGVVQSYRGVFRGCRYYNSAVGRPVWSQNWPGQSAAGTSSQTGDVQAFVEIDDQLYYTIQTPSSVIWGSSLIGFNVSVTANASTGNTTTGFSNVSVSSWGTGSSLPFRVVDVLATYSVPGAAGIINGTDTSTSAQIIIVAPNNWDTKALTGI